VSRLPFFGTSRKRQREFLHGYDFPKYSNNVLVQSAVERQFEIIGEALNQLSKVAPDIAAQVPDYRQIIAFRNILIHGYAVLDQVVVWKVVEQNLPQLERAVRRLLDVEDPSTQTS
jgi:uncharacterized protein with HEPN domain